MGEQGQKEERVGVNGRTRTGRGTGEYKWWNKDRKRKGEVLLGKQGQNGERVGVIGGRRTERGTGRC